VVDLTPLAGLRSEASSVAVNAEEHTGVCSRHDKYKGGDDGGEAHGALQGSRVPCR
jgi:hypothetical protein